VGENYKLCVDAVNAPGDGGDGRASNTRSSLRLLRSVGSVLLYARVSKALAS